MRLNMMKLILWMMLVSMVMSICPNNCSGYGKCEKSECVCFSNSESGEFYMGADCSQRGCPRGNPFSASPSVYPSVTESSSSYSPNIRGLSIRSDRRELSTDVSGFKMELKEGPLDDGKKLWKVSGIEELIEFFPKSGGIIECEFTKAGSPENHFVTVITHFSSHAYVLFDVEVDSATTYSSIMCKDIIKPVYDLSQINPNNEGVKTPTPVPVGRLLSNNKNTTRQLNEGEIRTFTWTGYGEILSEMGILKPITKESKTTYENDNITFACYSPPKDANAANAKTKSEAIIGAELKTYTGFKAVRESDKKNDIVFTKTDASSDNLPKAGDICLCLMDGEGKAVDIEDSEIKDNIRFDTTGNVYKIGKYGKADEAIKDHVAYGNVDNDKEITITSSLADDDKLYFSANREVYGTVIRNGIIREVIATLSENSVTVTATLDVDDYKADDGDIILPYLRSSPISQLTPSPKTKIVKEADEVFYKAYYFAENLLYSLKKEGGILECDYTNDDANPSTIPVLVDVKGIVKDSKNKIIINSYIEVTKINDDGNQINPTTGTFDCKRIKSIRSDLTTCNYPNVKFSIPASPATPITVKYEKYGPIFHDLGFAANDFTASITCFRVEDKLKQIISYSVKLTSGADSIDAVFEIQNTPAPPTEEGNYLCFMKTKFDKTDVKLEESDIKDNIKVDATDPPNTKYYYGEYILSDKTEYKKEEDNTEVIVLDKETKIALTSGDSITEATITIPDYNNIPSDIQKRLETEKKISLKVLKKESNYEEIIVDCAITNIDPVAKRSLEDEPLQKTITVSFDSNAIVAGDIPFYVLYLHIPEPPSETPTEQPITEIRNIDIESNFYEISNFLENTISELPLIGGKIQCKVDEEGKVGLIDVVGVKGEKNYYKFEKALNVRRRILEGEEKVIELKYIRECKIINIRRDMSFYNVIELEEGVNFDSKTGVITWIGYGEIFDSINGNLICYNPSKDSNKEMKIYENLKTYKSRNVKNKEIKDLNIQISNTDKPVVGEVCYMLSDANGLNVINIENSELSEFIHVESNKYYFGPSSSSSSSSTSNPSKNEEKKSDGSVSMTIDTKESVVTTKPNDDKDRFEKEEYKEKLDLFDINEPSSPSLYIPPKMIGIESEKMVVVGNTVELIFTKNGIKIGEGSAQILKIDKDGLGRYKIILSDQIYLPLTTTTRLRSLAGDDKIDSDVLVTINWKSEGSTHIAIECSGQGICDRNNGICKCYNGYSGSACQRLDCPNNCNGNGRCVSLSELLGNDELKEYIGFGNKHESKVVATGDANDGKNAKFANQVYGCLCDKRHRGYDCSLMECPSGEDPEEATNGIGKEYRDCSGRGICNYLSGICECFDGFSGEGCQNQIQTM